MPLRATIAALALLLSVSCSDAPDVAGLWEMPEGSNPLQFERFEAPFTGRVKLAVDQFGWDVAGVLLFYGDDLYYDLRECRYIIDGEVRKETFLFTVELDSGRSLVGTLAYDSNDGTPTLKGDLVDPDDNTIPPLHIVLHRVGDDDEVHREEWDLGCPER